MAKKKIAKPRQTRKTATARKPAKAVAAPKRPRGRPPKPKPTPAPAPTPQTPTEGQDMKLLEGLLLRLVSPLKALPVQTAEAVVYLRPENIAYLTTDGRRILIADRDGNEWQRFDTLKDLFARLGPDPRFFFAHKSCIINLFAVKRFRKNPQTRRNEVTFGDKVKGVGFIANGNLKEFHARMEL